MDSSLLTTGAIGFFRGLLLGGFITYFIQDSIRRHQVTALRRVPRAKFNSIATLQSDDQERKVDVRNISKLGPLVKCGCDFKEGDKISIRSPQFGTLRGSVRWTKPKNWPGKQLTGIEFDQETPELNDFMRHRYGEFYA